jgi:hypothetical protein
VQQYRKGFWFGQEIEAMRRNRVKLAGIAGMGLALSLLTGCQTWFGGMTLPSGRYLEHPPQYFPEDPDFPLSKELASQEKTLYQNREDDAVKLPPPVPPPPK